MMLAQAAAYVVAITTLVFCGMIALTLIYTVTHLDQPDAHSS